MIRTIDECFWGIQNGANIKQSKSSGGFPITRIETIADNKFNRDRVGYAGITDISSYESYILEDEDLLMSHINSAKYLGRTVLYNRRTNEVIIHGMNLLRLRAKKEIINPSYAKYLFSGCKFKKQVSRITKKSVNQASFTVGDLKKIKISVPSILEQVQIVEKLDRIAGIIELRQAEIEKAEEIIKARFIEVFGDMLLNSKSWREIRLDSVADIVSGITKGRKIKSAELYEVPYMAVSNVKNGYIDWTKVKTIMATKEEIKRYKLLPNDVLMTEGGDPDKLGRGAIIKCPPNNCIHQNHIFRVRLNEELLPIYFEYYLQQIKAKRYFLKCSKQTTGIASINMKQLLALPVLIPDMESQKTFAKFKEQADKSKSVIEKSLKELETLQASLMQKYFS